MNEVLFTVEELGDTPDDILLELLKDSWKVEDGEFEVIGELPALGDSSFAFLSNPILLSTGKQLRYPIQEREDKPCTFFMGPKDALRCGSRVSNRFVRCKLELSPRKEREKHENPFSMRVKDGTSEVLESLPFSVSKEILSLDVYDEQRSEFISKTLYDFFYENVMAEIESIANKKQAEAEESFAKRIADLDLQIDHKGDALKQIEERKQSAVTVVERLGTKKHEVERHINDLKTEKLATVKEIERLTDHYEKLESEMNNKIKRLKDYASEKAKFLKTFEFVEEDVLNAFLSERSPQSEQIEGLSFQGALGGDYQKAVSYVQAHLVQNDILYPRHIIENYLTLLRTKDLIILAGDSGSGKTNLVKSFAKAVGGKAHIIPVKPNWTSSEDLLGYYNPLEKKYLATPFLDAMLEAQQNPDVPHFICLDEMNLARVEYYFADFLSLLESRDEEPEINLYSEDESSHILSELKAVVDIIQSTKEKYKKDGIINFIDLLKDEDLNNNLRLAFGFSDKDSLLKYHSEIRRMLAGIMTMPSTIKIPANLHIIGAINIDETTHYLSPKILDRAHIMRFESPLLSDWDSILSQVNEYDFEDTSLPLFFDIDALGYRKNYPKFDRENSFCSLFIELNKEFFHKLGIEFGMRTIRQGLNYIDLFEDVNTNEELAINNFILHKILPKLTFDGNKSIGEQTKLELLESVFIDRLKSFISDYENYPEVFSSVHSLEKVIRDAKANDGVVNYWS